jgi:hypothetical protein
MGEQYNGSNPAELLCGSARLIAAAVRGMNRASFKSVNGIAGLKQELHPPRGAIGVVTYLMESQSLICADMAK